MCICFCRGGGEVEGVCECARVCVCVLVCLGDSFRYDNYIQGMTLCECVFGGVCSRARVCFLV